MPKKFDPDKHHRRSIRLPFYDYSQEGAYFITACAFQRAQIFSKIVDGKVVLLPVGKLIEEEWHATAKLRPYIELGPFVVMPDHIHGILFIREKVGPAQFEQYGKPTFDSIPTIIRCFKAAVTRRRSQVQFSQDERIWQGNYYEHVIRNANAFERISAYIENNPIAWERKKKIDLMTMLDSLSED